jgi:hypothetical protein
VDFTHVRNSLTISTRPSSIFGNILPLSSTNLVFSTMPPLLNDNHSTQQVRFDSTKQVRFDSTKQVRFDTYSFGASMATPTIHQHDLDRRQEQTSSAESVRVVSPGGQSNLKHHHQMPTARSSATKSIIKLPRWTSMLDTYSNNRLKDYRRSKSDMASTPSKNKVMHLPISILKKRKLPISILKKRKSSPRPTPTPLTERIVCATAGLLSLRALHAPNTPTIKATTTTSPGPTTTSTNQSSSSLPEKGNFTLSSDWDAMVVKHVATPVEKRSRAPADVQAEKSGLTNKDRSMLSGKTGMFLWTSSSKCKPRVGSTCWG